MVCSKGRMHSAKFLVEQSLQPRSPHQGATTSISLRAPLDLLAEVVHDDNNGHHASERLKKWFTALHLTVIQSTTEANETSAHINVDLDLHIDVIDQSCDVDHALACRPGNASDRPISRRVLIKMDTSKTQGAQQIFGHYGFHRTNPASLTLGPNLSSNIQTKEHHSHHACHHTTPPPQKTALSQRVPNIWSSWVPPYQRSGHLTDADLAKKVATKAES